MDTRLRGYDTTSRRLKPAKIVNITCFVSIIDVEEPLGNHINWKIDMALSVKDRLFSGLA
jgi:hypothetical protein